MKRLVTQRVLWMVVIALSVTCILLGRMALCPIGSCDREDIDKQDKSRDISSSPSGQPARDDIEELDCNPGVPCQYPDDVDLRLIVMTFDRPQSLSKLLASLDHLELDGHVASLEIWIDRHKDNTVDKATLHVANAFHWSRGRRRVHVHKKHVGLYGQWLDTWRPRVDSDELSLFLEDDLSLSPFAYRWLRAVHEKYRSRTDIAGYTLQSEGVNKANGGGALQGPAQAPVFLYKLLGSWGYAPHPQSWAAFLSWYHNVSTDINFRPYVSSAPLHTSWYKHFERQKKSDTMWTIWHIYYCDKYNMFTVYNNIGKFSNDSKALLCTNRKVGGLHYSGKGNDHSSQLLTTWSKLCVNLPQTPVRYDWNGQKV